MGKHARLTATSILGIACCMTISDASGAQTRAPAMIEGPAGGLYIDDGGVDGGRTRLPVVFLHSFAGSSAHWTVQLANLRATRRAVAIDFRGHGKSEAPRTRSYEVESLAADVAAVVDSLRLERFVLVGHSMGGAAAAEYARVLPDRVAGLVLVGTPGKSRPENASQIMASMRADYEKVTEGYWKSLLAGAQPKVETQIQSDLKRIPRESALAMIEAVFAFDPLPGLRAFRGPMLIIDTGHGDGPDALHHQLPNVRRTVIAGTSHWPQVDRPEEFNRILDEFLAHIR